MVPLTIRPATIEDIDAVASVLLEAAQWLDSQGMSMWRTDELTPERLRRDVADELFYVACLDEAVVGTVRFQLDDPEFWPDLETDDSAFVHRLAVRRVVSSQGVSTALLDWSARRARALGRRFLRLDCEVSRPRLRAVYERFGFRHHSDRQVGPYFVARYELDLTQWPGTSLRGTSAEV